MVFDIEKNEEQRLDKVESFLKNVCKLEVWREVIPDQCKNWKNPYQVDMIFFIQDYGFIGVEGKKLNTHGQGGKYADAYIQIRDKYKDKTYFNGKKVRRWCVLGANSSELDKTNRVECFIKHFLNRLGISYLEFINTKWKKCVVIDRLTLNKLEFNKSGITGINKKNFLDYGDNIK